MWQVRFKAFIYFKIKYNIYKFNKFTIIIIDMYKFEENLHKKIFLYSDITISNVFFLSQEFKLKFFLYKH